MPSLELKKYFGVKDVDDSKSLKFEKHPIAHFDLANFKIIPSNIISFKPIVTNIDSGWIIDGRFVVTDNGQLLGEGFYWSIGSIGNVVTTQNQKLKVEENSENLSIAGFADDKGNPIKTIREVEDGELKNSVFLSGFDNLSHFMMEVAPKTLLFPTLSKEFPNFNTIVLCDLVPKRWINYCIKIASSIDESDLKINIKQINSNKAIRFKNITVISSMTYKDATSSIHMSVNQAKYFSKLMCKHASSTETKKPYVLYMSRKNASHRKTLNQDNLIKIIKKIFPNFNLVIEDNIHFLTMEDQAKLIYNSSLIIEEGGGSTGFVSNLIKDETPYITIQTSQRLLDTGRLYLAGLNKYAGWVLGKPVGKSTESMVIDNDILVDEEKFEKLMLQISLFTDKKISLPKL